MCIRDRVKIGLVQALGVFIDTIVICSCTAFLILLVPQEQIAGLAGMDLLQTAMSYHLGEFGAVSYTHLDVYKRQAHVLYSTVPEVPPDGI